MVEISSTYYMNCFFSWMQERSQLKLGNEHEVSRETEKNGIRLHAFKDRRRNVPQE